MSTETILTRMMTDAKFAEAVFADAAKALAEYNLSAEDLAKFKGLTRAQFEGLSTEDRKSFGVNGDPETRNHNETLLNMCNEADF